MSTTKKIVVVFHSGYGHTKRMAEAVAEGAGASLLAIDAEGNLPDGGWDQLAADASSKPWYQEAWKDKIAAGFTNSASMNGDKHSTLHYLITLAMQHSMIWVGTGMLPSNKKSATRNDINYVASSSGAMASTPSDASVDEMLPGDLETAKLFGKRVAEVTTKWGA